MDNASEQIFKIAAEIEGVLQSNDLPAQNPNAVSRLRLLASQLHGIDNYAAQKAARIATLAEQFYSARKHQSYSGGADQLYRDMKSDLLSRIRAQAETRQAYEARG